MKQHISTRAIIRKDGRVLLLRRTNGQEDILSKYELPGGKINYGEQPEDALKRCIKEATGLAVQTTQLFDVLTYIDRDDRDTQHVLILYLVSLVSNGSKIRLNQNYDRYVWEKMSDIHQEEVTESTMLLLGISQQHTQSVAPADNPIIDAEKTSDITRVIVYSDGGSRGNPGPSAAGFVIMDEYDAVIQEGGVYLGITTNNQAEYHGVRIGLEKALEIGSRTIDFRIDSLLVVNQMNSIYKIKNRELWPIHERIRDLVTKFDKVTFTHVKREFNQLADGMVNKILDAHEGE
ncbi:MAG TPA: reverse transcriptase-like protein [Candidatus Saccharimonadales bacterium]|jgi:mutator protein MutT|nr:reverse transcriptase-like protein [Candidatus Saccharimonadales bacterium]